MWMHSQQVMVAMMMTPWQQYTGSGCQSTAYLQWRFWDLQFGGQWVAIFSAGVTKLYTIALNQAASGLTDIKADCLLSR